MCLPRVVQAQWRAKKAPMDGESKTLREYAQFLKAYANMRYRISMLMWAMEEEQVPTQTAAQRTADDLLDMAYEYMDDVNERLTDVDELMASVQSLLFGYHHLFCEDSFAADRDMDDLRTLLSSLALDDQGMPRLS